MPCTDKLDTRTYEIDKSKRRLKTEESIATVAMNNIEDPLQSSKMENGSESVGKPTELCLQASAHLISSTTSSLADTPGDSGVQCLDSDASEVNSQALMTHSLVGAEELVCDSQCDLAPCSSQEMTKSTSSSMLTRSDIDNQNLAIPDDLIPELIETHGKSPVYENLPDVVLKALESEKSSPKHKGQSALKNTEPKKSLSEDIVYRRRCRKKSQNGTVSQKKRVSFHEDILNNTRTDNIHIERGFVSYGSDSSYCDRFRKRNNIQTDRNSWCASGDKDTKYADDVAQQTMSDILTYGDVSNDKSGVFEYEANAEIADDNGNREVDNHDTKQRSKMYRCESNSTDSNFSCDSETSSESTSSNSNNDSNQSVHRKDKAQKSYSYDGFDNDNHVTFMRKTYFSEADIDKSHKRANRPLEVTESPNRVKSVLKKKRYITTNVVEEQTGSKKMLSLLDTKNIVVSLKNFYKNFNFKFTPEKGVPETHVDLNNVVEALQSDVNQNQEMSKSTDSGLQIEDEDEFVEINLNEPSVSTEKTKEMTASICSIAEEKPLDSSPRHKLTLNMKGQNDSKSLGKCENFPPITKYVVNCESTVYEHKGVTYSYVHDKFQTPFDAPKQHFVPYPEASPSKEPILITKPEMSLKVEEENLSLTSTPKRQYNKSILDEKEQKNSSKHLSSPKKQNTFRFGKKPSITLSRAAEDSIQASSENGSNTDNSTLKGADEFPEEFFDSPASTKLQSNKSALLNRYFKSVYQRKDLECKIRRNKFFREKLLMERGFPSIIFPMKLVSDTFHLSAEKMSRLISKEVIENKRLSVRLLTADEPSYFDSFEDNVAVECSEKLRLHIFSYPNETLNRMMRVQSPYKMEDGSWSPLLIFITSHALYLAGVKDKGTEYHLLCRLPHDQLDAIAVGPECQYIQIVDITGKIVCSVVTGESSLGARLASSLEWSARTSPLRIQQPPAVLHLRCHELAAQVAIKRHEKKVPLVMFYGRACSDDTCERLVDAPGAFAPPLEGYLMCRTEKSRRFEPCYFLLRAGVLQWGAAAVDGGQLTHSLPLRSVAGVRRLTGTRPHCFELAGCAGEGTLQMAAADDTSASAWLQSLLLHAAQALEEKDGKKSETRSKGPPAGCTVLVTNSEVISLRETMDRPFVAAAAPFLRNKGADGLLKEYIANINSDLEILACGSIKNLTAFKIPDTDDNWCCLEWSVCEARERGAGMALVFASSAELERFIAAVETAYCNISSDPFPLSVIDASKSSCSEAHSQFEAAWTHMLPRQ